MKKLLTACVVGAAITLPSADIYDAIAYVESEGNRYAIGDKGAAVGMYQIHKCYVDDVNRIANTNYTYEDRTDPDKSREMVGIYLNYYGRNYVRTTGKQLTYEVLARIHNGGPYGYLKESTIEYWNKVKEAMTYDFCY